MTLHQCVLTVCLGPPRRCNGSVWTWPCPVCGSQSGFRTLPTKSEYKDRAKCRSCDLLWDTHDVLKYFHPNAPFGDRVARLALLEQQWRAQNASLLGVEKAR